MTPTPYPLSWPPGKAVTEERKSGQFYTELADAYDGILAELRRFGADDVVISSNVRFGPRGRTQFQKGDSPGVAVWFRIDGETVCLAIDQYALVADNLQAIHKSIAAIRGLQRWGFGRLEVGRSLRAMGELPPSTMPMGAPPGTPIGSRPWWQVLEVRPDADTATINVAYRRLARVRHPDMGGTNEGFAELQAAYEQSWRATA